MTMKRLLSALFGLLLWLASAGPSVAAIGNPTLLGSCQSGGATTCQITTSAACSAGNFIALAVSYVTLADTLSSATDSGSNTYIVVENDVGTGSGLGFAYKANNAAVANGGTITATFAGSTVNQTTAVCVTGVATSSPLDTSGHTSQGTAATVATSVATGTLAQAVEIVFGDLVNVSAVTSVSSAGFTDTTGGSTRLHLFYQVVNATTTVTWVPGWTTSSNYISAVFSFKGALAGAGAALLGVGQ